ncbi:hypothetical protein JOD43_001261 [Pullulanibacillus pueri]|uniref:Uncharacterized protein n=1 Tax=Pullulanibacillus pueri TaxID=1437324 RepID=A0A8J3ELM7_9BACL|nr:hypothetical protein [Pullulanibacillus pueri]MBM7681094.1 hypothetical protein [Pullulanibacillus pueri]GGH77021.1 hypothetical protein GCM10007096_08300 [Pullulanibacillus pueri]
MGLIDVFNTIVEIMHHDYAGYQDKQGWDHPDIYKKRLVALEAEQKLTRESFEEIVNDYLLEFRDDHNRLISSSTLVPPQTIGFNVRRYEKALYIERVTADKKFRKGEWITAIDGQGIEELAKQHRLRLKSDLPEREDWTSVLLQAQAVTVKGEIRELHHYEDIKEAAHYTYTSEHHIPILTFNDFTDLK